MAFQKVICCCNPVQFCNVHTESSLGKHKKYANKRHLLVTLSTCWHEENCIMHYFPLFFYALTLFLDLCKLQYVVEEEIFITSLCVKTCEESALYASAHY